MNYYLVDFDKESDDFNMENLIIDSKIELDTNNFKYLLYYHKDTARDIYLKLPKIKLIYDWSNLKYNQLKIRITPKYEKAKDIVHNYNSDSISRYFSDLK